MSTLSERWRNSSRAFRVFFVLLLSILLLLLCLLAFVTYLWPIISPTPAPAPIATTPPPTTAAPTEIAALTTTPPSTPTGTPVVTESPAEAGTVTATSTPTPITPTVTITATATPTCVIEIHNVMRNGNFEEGFQSDELGNYWNGFHNGNAAFSFHIDDWPLVVVEGEHTQLIEIKDAVQPNRYFGIYQTAEVIPGEVYTFSMRGLVRTNIGDVEKTSYGYRLQVGFDLSGGQDWQEVENWVELPWDEQLRLQDSFRFDTYTTTLTAESDTLTVFVRAWKKWADSGEGDYDVDDIQLVGLACVTPPAPAVPVTGASTAILDNVRVWATIALLLLLLGGAAWRFGWKRT
ncbi:MAG: hypothetical protein JSV81_20655 [Anaerolineales bacterium]|nr:MAG: hypothetical protein JSV81_20655 [Anaerolineales bacterium]